VKHPGLFVPLDVNYVSDEGIRRAGIAAELLFIRALVYAKRTNSHGFIPDYDLPVIAVGLHPDGVPQSVAALIHWELWVEAEGGWHIRSWERWNSAPDEAEKERKKAQARERKRRQREREAAERKAAEEAADVAPGQLKLVPSGDETGPGSTSDVTRKVTRDSHGVTPPKRREEKRSNNYFPSPDGEDENEGSGGEEDPKPPAKKKVDYTEETPDFVRFYSAYPRKVDRKDACKAWHQALVAGVDPEHIIAAAERYAAIWDPADRKHTKHPGRWLRAGSYDNAPEDLAPAANDSRFRGGPRTLNPHQDYENREVII
jgi:hypothetical protein